MKSCDKVVVLVLERGKALLKHGCYPGALTKDMKNAVAQHACSQRLWETSCGLVPVLLVPTANALTFPVFLILQLEILNAQHRQGGDMTVFVVGHPALVWHDK